MASLRTRRPTIAEVHPRPSQQDPNRPTYVRAKTVNRAPGAGPSSGVAGLGAGGAGLGVNLGGGLQPGDAGYQTDRVRDARKSRVGDKMRHRMSMRYADPAPLGLSAPPPLPPSSQTLGAPREMRKAYLTPNPDLDDLDQPTPIAPSGPFAPAAFENYSLAHGYSGPSAKDMLPTTTTTKDEEYVKPRGSIAPVRMGRGEWKPRGQGAGGILEEGDEKGGRWDLEGLKGEVDVGAHLKKTLAGAEEDEVAGFKTALMDRKGANANELKQNVFKNYAEFILIAKELQTLETDMQELKDLLTEWKTVPDLLGVGVSDPFAGGANEGRNGGMSTLERRRTQRSSVLDLQSLYKTQILNLHTLISGSAKFLIPIPGRHLIYEAANFVELNPATYKVKGAVELFLLDDLLMVAGRRRKRGEVEAGSTSTGKDSDERGRLVAERCWALTEVVVVDVKDSGDLTNAIKIRRGKETFVYRTSRPEDKKSLLNAFRQVAEELANKKRKENEKEQERRKSMWSGDMAGRFSISNQGGQIPMHVPAVPSMRAALAAADGQGHDDWADTFEDELTMSVATREWEQAVELVVKARKYLSSPVAKALPSTSLTQRLNTLSSQLVSSIAYDLSDPSIRKSSVVRLVGLLTALNESELARDTFLKSRAEVLGKRVIMIGFEGNVRSYVNDLGAVVMGGLKNTAEWYLTAFKENRMASGLVQWAKAQIEIFADKFRRQVYSPSMTSAMIEDCLRDTAVHNRKLLRDAGLDFTFLLSTLLQPNWNDPDVQPNAIIAERSTPPTTRQPSPPIPSAPTAPAAPQASPKPPPRSDRRARPAPRTSMMSNTSSNLL